MGWLSYTLYDKTPRQECDSICNFENETGKCTVLKSAMVGSTYYAAVKREDKTGESKPYIFAAVFLTSRSRRDGMNFGYKDMDESVGPCESKCPVGILDLLTPIEEMPNPGYAADWRKRCREYHAKASAAAKLNDGDVIVLETPIKFSDGYVGARFVIASRLKNGRKKRYFRSVENGGAYRFTLSGEPYKVEAAAG